MGNQQGRIQPSNENINRAIAKATNAINAVDWKEADENIQELADTVTNFLKSMKTMNDQAKIQKLKSNDYADLKQKVLREFGALEKKVTNVRNLSGGLRTIAKEIKKAGYLIYILYILYIFYIIH